MHTSDTVTYTELAEQFASLETKATAGVREAMTVVRAMLEEVIVGRGEDDAYLLDELGTDSVTVPVAQAQRIQGLIHDIRHKLAA